VRKPRKPFGIGTLLAWGIAGSNKTVAKMQGATVISFDAEGCMASDHVFKWVGTIESFESAERYTYAIVKVAKRAGVAHDVRDKGLGHAKVLVEAGDFQYIGPGLYFVFR
jgi:hypothetical protein